MLNKVYIFFFNPLSFQRRKCPWKADVRVEWSAFSLNVWVESAPEKPVSGSAGDANERLQVKEAERISEI